MKNEDIKAEILAPAGSFESLRAAVVNGADAVYLGLSSFSARASAQNFTPETLAEAVDYARVFGVKIYLTLNTLLKDSELDGAAALAKGAWDCGVNAVIVQDLGLAQRLKRERPEIVLHASTQMGVHNLSGALAAQRLGMDRVILSRETPLSEIKNIAENCSVELEHFVHGALCCGFSGNCYFSSLLSGKSGNRGRCLQLCRKPYLLEDKGGAAQGYWLSTRDTMLANDLKRLYEAGIRSFKIEGRMRRAEYVGEVTRIYKRALEGAAGQDDIRNLKLMFNRGNFSRAHIDAVDGGIIYPALQSHMGIRLGAVKSVFGFKAALDCSVSKGDGLKFLRDSREVGHALVLRDGFETGFVGQVRAGDGVYLTDSAKKNGEINARTRKVPVRISADFSLADRTCTVELSSGDKSRQFVYPIDLQPPQRSPVSAEDIKECLTSLGGTHFECAEFCVRTDGAFFALKAALKGLRRQFIADFERYLIDSFDRPSSDKALCDVFKGLVPLSAPEGCMVIMCGVQEAKEYEPYADYIALKPQNYAELLEGIRAGRLTFDKNRYMLDLPAVAFGADTELIEQIIQAGAFNKYIVNNIYGLGLDLKGEILLGYKMNMLNDVVEFAKVASVEGALREKAADNSFVYVFGRPDLMQTVHCYYKLKRGCGKCGDTARLTLTDDRGESYGVVKQKVRNCYNLLVSNAPVNISERGVKKRFFDAVNLGAGEKESLLEYLKGGGGGVVTQTRLAERKLD